MIPEYILEKERDAAKLNKFKLEPVVFWVGLTIFIIRRMKK